MTPVVRGTASVGHSIDIAGKAPSLGCGGDQRAPPLCLEKNESSEE